MIERYTLPEMGNLWSEEAKFQSWLDVEIAATGANCQLGRVPKEAMAAIRERARFDVPRILEIEAEVRHDVIAFLTNVNEHVGDAGRYIHVGMTSSDVLDTGLALQLKASVALLRQELDQLAAALRTLAAEHKDTVMIGRSHAIHGEPITFGFKVAGWLAETERNRERLERLAQVVAVGQVSGAMGTYANTDPQVEALTCASLGLEPDTASTQVIGRDRHAEYVQTLALVGTSLERFSTEIRNLQRTDVLEVEENFAKGQKGSSAMPHKRNPIRSERISGLARVLRSYTIAALENVALWHERDISHSSVERMMLPDCSCTLHFMLREMTEVVKGLGVYPENMSRNLNVYGGVVFSQRVLLALVESGLSREDAYRIVQRHAHEAWNREGGDFRANLSADPEVSARLNAAQLDACFSTELHRAQLDVIWERLGI
ncbi:adenylosuccinate lyase [Synechococcus sp. Cruz-9H2]|uniref:adenylosuccinate lyase n=1 Tax=unclassified Synechococcus TaxID=2626047 RepID=UPI0020CE8C2A|nr:MULTISPECIES: adenylosuccinate lyase [unclassified Synechococcus]MCP9819080.1 adenylosuccinate lyase [Synechococcus sp. Cruz-9H2]MCP9843584.1 adenylosuccinate lyase [Synechococcus sp. Edmonson 11F2]MCP9855697.1 adenylosuccinate lyase [Synechococcus sp. Cruz-9C9]MCP9863135.1 adenylosuccinate lyase [Synechococcus sp. Cruz-7E5]MCP9869990.1 adenylosuccinate lyase [Synechococcus sp. Cruz-7B9]